MGAAEAWPHARGGPDGCTTRGGKTADMAWNGCGLCVDLPCGRPGRPPSQRGVACLLGGENSSEKKGQQKVRCAERAGGRGRSGRAGFRFDFLIAWPIQHIWNKQPPGRFIPPFPVIRISTRPI